MPPQNFYQKQLRKILPLGCIFFSLKMQHFFFLFLKIYLILVCYTKFFLSGFNFFVIFIFAYLLAGFIGLFLSLCISFLVTIFFFLEFLLPLFLANYLWYVAHTYICHKIEKNFCNQPAIQPNVKNYTFFSSPKERMYLENLFSNQAKWGHLLSLNKNSL